MLKKLGLVSVGVTAGVLAAAPLASASPAASDCNVVADSEGGNNYGADVCNQIGKGNGEGNTFNGVEIPGPPPLPSAPTLPDFSEIASGLPSSFALPGIPA